MAAVDFPSSPTNGQTFSSGGKTWTYDGTGWVLNYTSATGGLTKVSATAPLSPQNGDVWIDSNTWTQYAYYTDGTSNQWVEVSSSVKPTITSGTIASRPAASLTGLYYFATDTNKLYIDTGSAWLEVATGTSTGNFGAWTSYTPTWSSTGGATTIGNGTQTGAYCQVGKLVTARFYVTFGSTTSFTGNAGFGNGYLIALPVTAASGNDGFVAGNVVIGDDGVGRYSGSGWLYGTTKIMMVMGHQRDTVGGGSGYPWAGGPAANDFITGLLTYEAA